MKDGLLYSEIIICYVVISVSTSKPTITYQDTIHIYLLIVACDDETQIQCDMGMCLPKAQFCDGINHCPDESDEPVNCSRSQLLISLWSQECLRP